MRKIQLRFPSVLILWNCMQVINADFVHVNAAEKTLTCHCSEEDVELAVKEYGAEIMQSNTIDTSE